MTKSLSKVDKALNKTYRKVLDILREDYGCKGIPAAIKLLTEYERADLNGTLGPTMAYRHQALCYYIAIATDIYALRVGGLAKLLKEKRNEARTVSSN